MTTDDQHDDGAVAEAALDQDLADAEAEAADTRALHGKPMLGQEFALKVCKILGLDPAGVQELTIRPERDGLVHVAATVALREEEGRLVLKVFESVEWRDTSHDTP